MTAPEPGTKAESNFRLPNFKLLCIGVGFNNVLFIIRYIHAYIQTIQLTIGSDGKHTGDDFHISTM